MKPQTWLVTGGAGFLGQATVQRLLELGHHVRVLDIASKPAIFEGKNIEFIQGNVEDADVVAEACDGVAGIFHEAAALPIHRSRELIFGANEKGTKNVMEGAIAAGVPRVVFVSTTAVYGLHKFHPIHEDIPLVPVGYYGESKIAAEKVAESYRDRLHVTIIRPKTFLGTGRLGVFEILFDWIADGKRIPMIGNGHNKYQLLDVEDLVDIMWLAVHHKNGNDTFNAAASEFGTLRQDLAPLFAAAGHEPRFLPTPRRTTQTVLWTLDKMRLSPLSKWHYGTMASDSYVEVEKAKRLLGWTPKRSNQDTLLAAYNWYHENREKVKSQTGTTHTVGWDQKILGFFKRFA